MKKKASEHSPKSLAKSATGIRGLDEITGGGLPAGTAHAAFAAVPAAAKHCSRWNSWCMAPPIMASRAS